MVDIPKLRGAMAEAGVTNDEMSKHLGMCRSTWYHIMLKRRDVTLGEATQISAILNLNEERKRAIFVI